MNFDYTRTRQTEDTLTHIDACGVKWALICDAVVAHVARQVAVGKQSVSFLMYGPPCGNTDRHSRGGTQKAPQDTNN